MAEKDKITSGKIRHTGLFLFKDAYNFLYDWLVDYKYDISEDKYSEKIKPEGKEIGVEWTASRKISDYFKFVWVITFRLLGITKQEIKGRKFDKGYIEIAVNAFLVKDYESKWESQPFTKFLRDLYNRYIIKSRIEDYEDRITEEVDEALTQIKTFLALEAKRES